MSKWRWDQGRLDYFQFDEIKKISCALVNFDGKSLPRGDDPDNLRIILESYSERPFSPASYMVWRNYKRVFGCLLLAVEIHGVMLCTDICKDVANGKIDSNEYIINLSKRFYYSSPVFDGYSANDEQIFPICAIVKFLISRYIYNNEFVVSVDQIISFVKGNNLTGFESLESFAFIAPTGLALTSSDDELRQIREMIRFISQLSFLKWNNPNILLDVQSKEEAMTIAELFTPVVMPRKDSPAAEILQLGRIADKTPEIIVSGLKETNPFDMEFSEGSKLRVSHMRTERSGKLKEFYYQHAAKPNFCDMCAMDTQKRYPWAARVVELHHLLPLSSPIRVEKNSSSLKDIVGLCPTCHRATHKFYAKWFKENELKDFRNYNEAKTVYGQAKSSIEI